MADGRTSATVGTATTTSPTHPRPRPGLTETRNPTQTASPARTANTPEHGAYLPPPGYQSCESKGEIYLNQINDLKTRTDFLLNYVASNRDIDRANVYMYLNHYLDEWQRIKEGLNEVSRSDALWDHIVKTFNCIKQVHKSIANLLRMTSKKVDNTCQYSRDSDNPDDKKDNDKKKDKDDRKSRKNNSPPNSSSPSDPSDPDDNNDKHKCRKSKPKKHRCHSSSDRHSNRSGKSDKRLSLRMPLH